MKIKCWIEAMRLRTLPVSVAGVVMAAGCAVADDTFRWLPVTLCLVFAVLAQIASNFANEYYDFKRGFDRVGREGPRRGVTEGDITPRAMCAATFITLGVACCVGLSLLMFSGWWLVPLGLITAVGVLAYSTGPYPLSHHGMGEVAVVFFFGIIPVCCTYVLQGGEFGWPILAASVSIGLMGANVLIVNNYRDYEDDRAVGKHTLAVIIGSNWMPYLYIANGVAAMVLLYPRWVKTSPLACLIIMLVYVSIVVQIALAMRRLTGRKLTPLLGMTAVAMLLFSIAYTAVAAFS